MPKLRVHNFSVSLDGYAAGVDQGIDEPLDVGGERLHEWMFATPTGAAMVGGAAGEPGVDDEFVRRGLEGMRATIMGRNMFGPVRGPWPDDELRGWWGDDRAVPPRRLRPDAPPARAGHDGRRDDVPLRAGRHPAGAQRAFGVAGGADVRLFEDLDGALDGYECAEFVSSAAAAHYRLVRRSS